MKRNFNSTNTESSKKQKQNNNANGIFNIKQEFSDCSFQSASPLNFVHSMPTNPFKSTPLILEDFEINKLKEENKSLRERLVIQEQQNQTMRQDQLRFEQTNQKLFDELSSRIKQQSFDLERAFQTVKEAHSEADKLRAECIHWINRFRTTESEFLKSLQREQNLLNQIQTGKQERDRLQAELDDRTTELMVSRMNIDSFEINNNSNDFEDENNFQTRTVDFAAKNHFHSTNSNTSESSNNEDENIVVDEEQDSDHSIPNASTPERFVDQHQAQQQTPPMVQDLKREQPSSSAAQTPATPMTPATPPVVIASIKREQPHQQPQASPKKQNIVIDGKQFVETLFHFVGYGKFKEASDSLSSMKKQLENNKNNNIQFTSLSLSLESLKLYEKEMQEIFQIEDLVNSAFQGKRWSDCITLCEKALVASPRSERLHEMLAECLTEQRDFQKVLTTFSELLKFQQQKSAATTGAAFSNNNNSNCSSSNSSHSSVHYSKNNNVSNDLNLKSTTTTTNVNGKSTTSVQQQQTSASLVLTTRLSFLLAKALYMELHFEQSLVQFKSIVSDCPEAKKFVSLLEPLLSLLSQCGNSRNLHSFSKSQLERIVQLYGEALKIDPTHKKLNSLLLSNRAAVYLLLGQFRDALKDCDDVISTTTNNENSKILKRRACVYAAIGLFQNARLELIRATESGLDRASYEKLDEEFRRAEMWAEKHRNFYQILRVKREATKEEIKKSYRTFARLFHPDQQVKKSAKFIEESTKNFKLLNSAHETLINSQSKEEYDNSIRHLPDVEFKFSFM